MNRERLLMQKIKKREEVKKVLAQNKKRPLAEKPCPVPEKAFEGLFKSIIYFHFISAYCSFPVSSFLSRHISESSQQSEHLIRISFIFSTSCPKKKPILIVPPGERRLRLAAARTMKNRRKPRPLYRNPLMMIHVGSPDMSPELDLLNCFNFHLMNQRRI